MIFYESMLGMSSLVYDGCATASEALKTGFYCTVVVEFKNYQKMTRLVGIP